MAITSIGDILCEMVRFLVIELTTNIPFFLGDSKGKGTTRARAKVASREET